MEKDDFLRAYASISKIEDLLTQANDLMLAMHSSAPGIVQAILDYHSITATLPHCLRWGKQAAKDIREDWHTVVSNIHTI